MQTFLPYANFRQSADVLDRQRLGKQRVEVLQIMAALNLDGPVKRGWSNHPATKMWRGYAGILADYGFEIIREWKRRGYNDTCFGKLETLYGEGVFARPAPREPQDAPVWLGDAAFHRSHQSNLVRKDVAHYGPLFPGVPDDLEYVWPEPVKLQQ